MYVLYAVKTHSLSLQDESVPTGVMALRVLEDMCHCLRILCKSSAKYTTSDRTQIEQLEGQMHNPTLLTGARELTKRVCARYLLKAFYKRMDGHCLRPFILLAFFDPLHRLKELPTWTFAKKGP